MQKKRTSKESILRAVKPDTKQRVSYTKNAEKVVLPLSKSTIRRNLKCIGEKCVPSTNYIILNDSQKYGGSNCQKLHMELIDFHKVNFTNECRFVSDGNDNIKTWSKNSNQLSNNVCIKEDS